MKKGLLSLLALALTVVGCQNYDDQFAELTTLIESVQADVDGLSDLQSDVDALAATLSGLSAAVASNASAIAAGNTAAAAAAASNATAIGENATAIADAAAAAAAAAATTDAAVAANASAIAANASATADAAAAAAAASANTDAAVASNATQIGNLATGLNSLAAQVATIQASLTTVADADDIAALNLELDAIQEDLDELLAANATINQSITINSLATLQYAESLISTDPLDPNVIVNGNVTVDVNQAFATTAGVTIDRINAVTNKFATVLGTTTGGLLSASYTASPSIGNLQMNNLVFVDTNIDISGSSVTETPILANVTGAASITYSGSVAFATPITITGALVVGGDITSLDFTNGSAASLASSGDAAGVLDLPNAVSINAGDATVTTVIAPKAQTVTLGKAAALTELIVTSATELNSLIVEATSVGTLTISGQDSQTTIDLNDLETISGPVTIGDAATVGLADLTTINNKATIGGNDVSIAALATVTGTLEISDDVSVSLPVFAPTATTTLTLAETATLKSASSTLLKGPELENLTLTAQPSSAAGTFIADATTYPSLTDLTITGVEDGDDPTAQANALTVSGGVIEDVTVNGWFDSITVTATTDLTDLEVNGENNALTIGDNADLVNLTLNHDHIEGADAHYLTVTDNTELLNVTTANLEELGDVLIYDNAKLSTIDLNSADGTSPVAGTFTVSISGNNLVGDYIAAIAQTTTTILVDNKIQSDDILSIKRFIDDKAAAVTYSFTIDIDVVNYDPNDGSAISTKTLADAFTADTTATASATGSGYINTDPELALVEAED